MVKRDLGIYIHIPFCVKKCDYCDFCSAPGTAEEQAYYFRNLQKEIRTFESLGNLYQIKTLFIGGGTPSSVESSLIKETIELLKSQYEFAPDAEMTIECNPGTITEEKLKTYMSLGFNRLSLGLQSAQEEELAELGRIHSFDEFCNNFALARRLGYENINVDLMFGIPKQKQDSWKDTLEKVLEIKPDHISAYSLIVEEGTPFFEKYGDMVGARALPSERDERAMYHYAVTRLAEAGFKRYEISNFATEGKECKHNMLYWTMGEYLGFGLSASSYLNGKRFTNPKNKEEYWDYSRRAYSEYRFLTPQSEKSTMEEFMFLGLRTDRGISRMEFEEFFHVPFESVYAHQVERLLSSGLLKEEDGRIALTDRGIDVSNRVLAEFLL